jgi:DNA-binding protein H-NS
MSDEKKKISAWVSCDLLESVLLTGYQNYTDAVISGLKLIVDQTIVRQNQTESDHFKSVELAQARATLEGIEKLCEEKNKLAIELQEQIKVKDEQLRAKDNQLEQLTETMQAQSIHLQTLINQKAIEAPGAKKPWWRFW